VNRLNITIVFDYNKQNDLQSITYKTNDRVTRTSLEPGRTRKLMNWWMTSNGVRSCYCCHKLGHWGVTSSGYGRVTVITNIGHWWRTSSGYGRVTVVTNSETEEWQAVASVVLLLSQTRTLMKDKQWLRSCYCCHKLGHRGMTSSGYDRVTVVTNSDIAEWQAVATVVLLLS
jgi:hypothetical protein